MADIRERMLRAVKLDPELYEEVEADPSAMGQATTVVVLSALAAGIGNLTHGGVVGVLTATVGALIGWYVWAFLNYWIGTRLLPEPSTQADHGQLLRTMGFAAAPGLIRVLGVVPGLWGLVFGAAAIWMLVAMVIAVRQALDYQSTARAVGVCAAGWIVQALVLGILLSLVGPA